jgi:hypothetical protein
MPENPTCISGGYLVGPDYSLPDNPKIYYNDPQKFPIGCNRIFCDVCHQFVRQWPGYSLPHGSWSLTLTDRQELFETLDPDQSRFLAKSERYRVYVCKCWADSIVSPVSLGRDYLDWDDWFCGGHPQ